MTRCIKTSSPNELVYKCPCIWLYVVGWILMAALSTYFRLKKINVNVMLVHLKKDFINTWTFWWNEICKLTWFCWWYATWGKDEGVFGLSRLFCFLQKQPLQQLCHDFKADPRNTQQRHKSPTSWDVAIRR